MGIANFSGAVADRSYAPAGDGVVHCSADLPEESTADQRAAFAELVRFIQGRGDSPQSRVLSGYAGTGKTWLLVQLILAANNQRVAVCAPTHKAVAVITTKLAESKPIGKIWSGTLHALLGLRLREDRDGGMQLDLDRQDKGTYFEDYDLVVIDEASMVGTQLLSYIAQFQHSGRRPRVLYVGDPGQLLPVEPEMTADDLGPLFAQTDASETHRAPPVFETIRDRHALIEIVRQKSTGKPHPIAVFAQEIRRYIEGSATGVFTPSLASGFIAAHADDMGRNVMVSPVERIAAGAVTLRTRFPSKDIRVVAWRNQVVDRHNAFIHRELTSVFEPGDHLLKAPYWPGETLVAREAMYGFKPAARAHMRGAKFWEDALSPTLEDDGQRKAERPDDVILVQNNTEMTARSCVPMSHPYANIACWWITAEMPGLEVVEFFVASSPQEHRSLQQEAWNEYRNAPRRTTAGSRRAWTVTRACAPAMHGYAMTAHKSQGSTFHYAIVDLNDLYGMVRKSGPDEYHRAFYVAVTRAAERVWIGI
uniref:UvrD-like helicase C-terminal domain-containing protein n=1 Tax=mine drainage metagenome TaxID=410659 RepID=E6QLX4_9ZZZZ